jgi:lipoprotein-anchoring transpeptidase ErfK/SrfK
VLLGAPVLVCAVSFAAWAVAAYGGAGDGRAAPRPSVTGYYTPEAGSTVGTGMIVSIVFDHPVTDRAAVRRAVTVTARPAVPVAGHWFGARRLDFRPERYWAPGTRVDLRLRLRGVRVAADRYGTQSKDVVFRVGRFQLSTVDTARHTMVVRRAGRVLRVLPVSAGAAGHETYNGLMVISQKLSTTRMNAATVGFGSAYDIADVPHAMRLTDSGTFLHGNYWSPPAVFGTANASHGCVGLADGHGGDPDSPAGWFYDQSLVGDVVEVVGSHQRTVAPDNGLGGWNMPWAAWSAAPAGG